MGSSIPEGGLVFLAVGMQFWTLRRLGQWEGSSLGTGSRWKWKGEVGLVPVLHYAICASAEL